MRFRMRPFLQALPRRLSTGLLITGCVLVGGCSVSEIFKSVKTDYALQGEAADPETGKYLRTILDERVAEKTKTLKSDDDPDLRSRQESYIGQTVRADLLKALHAKGYYAAKVSFADGEKPLSGVYEIEYGPRFTIASIVAEPDSYSAQIPEGAARPGAPLDAEAVLAAQAGLYNAVQKDRCYFSLDVGNEVYLDKANHTGAVRLAVDAGREGKFGSVVFRGNGRVKESYLRKLLPWKEGQCFRTEKLESYKTALLQSGLFSRAEVVLPEEPGENGEVPVTLELKERAARTLSAGLSYYSDEGPGGVLSWEHRNLLGAAEKFRPALNLSMLRQSLDLDLTKPFFIRNDQSLALHSSLRRQDTDAFEEFALDLGGSIQRKFGHHLTGSTGVDVSLVRITDQTEKTGKTFGLLSAPQTLNYDTRDDPLDPRKGWNLSAAAEPFFDILGEGDPFFKTQFTGSGYLFLGTGADIVIAGKANIGGLWGAALENIPATERFYAGGGGTVRGYGYQEVGPQKDGDPTGGLSLAAASLELRMKFTDKIGGVAFVDAGSVGEDSMPSFSDPAIGAGAGVRYYTSFGPVRFDIATPLTQKEDLDRNYQFYISIGQAF